MRNWNAAVASVLPTAVPARPRRRRVGTTIAGLLAVTMLIGTFVAAGPAAAGDTSSEVECSAAQSMTKEERAGSIHNAVARMMREGLTDDQITKELATTHGVTVVAQGHPESSQVSSNQGHINLWTPSIAYASCGGGWYVWARYNWTSIDALSDEVGFTPGCGACNHGGDDGFGIAFSRNVLATSGTYMSTWGRVSHYPQSPNRTWRADYNVYGVTYRGQDIYCKQNAASTCGTGDYNFYNGELFYYISSIGCGTLQAFAKYGHTWSSTNINSISAGPWSVGISWSTSENKWEKASGSSNQVVPC